MGYFRHQYDPIKWDVYDNDNHYYEEQPTFNIDVHKVLGGSGQNDNSEVIVITNYGHYYDQFLFHHISFSFKTKKSKDGFSIKADGDEFEISTFLTTPFEDNCQMEETARSRLNCSTIYVTNSWENFILDPKGLLNDPDDIKTTSNKPFKITYGEANYKNNDVICVDNGFVVEYKSFEIKTIVHTEVKYGWSEEDIRWYGEDNYKNHPKQWWRYKYYFITVKNKDTGTIKKYSYLKLEGEHYDRFDFERHIYG